MQSQGWCYQEMSILTGKSPWKMVAFGLMPRHHRNWLFTSFVLTQLDDSGGYDLLTFPPLSYTATQTREIYCRPPKDGLPGVHPDSLLKVNAGVYGLREAPRLWYLKANRILLEAGWEELNGPILLCPQRHEGQRQMCRNVTPLCR